MGDIWLHKLPDYFDKWGVDWDAYPGWQTRSRSTGGFTAVQAIQAHHTVSKTTLANDAYYCWQGASTKPIGNMLLDRNGHVLLGAAGASNTSGKGGPMLTSRGVIPLDTGNTRIVAIEAQNDGVGEAWPELQQTAYINLVCAIKDWADNETPGPPLDWGAIHSHREWAPLRKVDTRGPSRWADDVFPWTWEMGAFRFDCAARWAEFHKPTTIDWLPDEGDDMALRALIKMDNDDAVFQVFDGFKVWCPNGPAVEGAKAIGSLSGKKLSVQVYKRGDPGEVALVEAMGPVFGPRAGGLDEYGIKR